MQTKKILNALALLFIVSVAWAQRPYYSAAANSMELPEKYGSFQVSVIPDGSTAFTLQVQNPENKRLQLLISHMQLGSVADTSFSSNTFTCRYNLREVEDGRYVVIVSSGKEKISKEIELYTVTTRNIVVH